MSDTIALWHAEHVNFAKLLDLLEGQLDLFHKGESPDYELMLDIMFYMKHYPDVLHHPKEDLAFCKGREKSHTPVRRSKSRTLSTTSTFGVMSTTRVSAASAVSR